MIHQFKNNGVNIVMDINSGAIHVVDDLTYDLIQAHDTGVSYEGIEAMLKEKYPEVPRKEVAEAYHEILQLMDEELLFTDDPYEEAVVDFSKRPVGQRLWIFLWKIPETGGIWRWISSAESRF